MSPERLWLLSISLQRRGHRRLALFVKRLNAMLYHNSLPINASVSPDIRFEHHGFGVIVHDNVVIGRRVKIFHHVTLAARSWAGVPAELIIEDDVVIGANAVVITPVGKSLRIERAARIGAGAVVTHDVPAGATVVSAEPRVLMHRSGTRLALAEERDSPEAPVAEARTGSSAGAEEHSGLLEEE
jgi:serine O-acetyltransferase